MKRGCKNLGGYLVGGAWRYLPLWRVCTRHTRPYLEDRWRPGLIPWYAAGGPNTWFFFADSARAEHRSCCGWCRPLIKRERVFSRLLVKFRVDRRPRAVVPRVVLRRWPREPAANSPK